MLRIMKTGQLNNDYKKASDQEWTSNTRLQYNECNLAANILSTQKSQKI